MKRKGRRRPRHDHREGDGDESAKKAKAAGPDICDDVLLGILSRLETRDATRCAALSKHHRRLIGGVDFWLLQRRLGPPLPQPRIAYMAAVGVSDPTSDDRRPVAAPFPDRVLPGCMFLDFHLAGGLAGGRPGDSNDYLRYSLIDRVHLSHRYVGTCNGVILMAPESFDGGASSILLFNPAVAGSEVAVRMELPHLPEPGRYRVSGFGNGTSSKLHKVLVTREERDERTSRRVVYRATAKELLVYTLGGSSSPDQWLRSVLSELDAKNVGGSSIYLDGKIYLLAGHSRVLAVDVDDESVTTIDLPGERKPGKRRAKPKLMEVSGRLCVPTDDADDQFALWLLAPDQQWVRLCKFWCGGGRGTANNLAGAWDCGGVVLLYFVTRFSKVPYLHMYDTRGDGDGVFSRLDITRAVAEQGGGSSELVQCWGYQPTLVSPGSIVGAPPRQRGAAGGVVAAPLNPLVERNVNAGRERTLDAVCFVNLLLYVMTKLLHNKRDLVRLQREP